jgi:hypothetical protein
LHHDAASDKVREAGLVVLCRSALYEECRNYGMRFCSTIRIPLYGYLGMFILVFVGIVADWPS